MSTLIIDKDFLVEFKAKGVAVLQAFVGDTAYPLMLTFTNNLNMKRYLNEAKLAVEGNFTKANTAQAVYANFDAFVREVTNLAYSVAANPNLHEPFKFELATEATEPEPEPEPEPETPEVDPIDEVIETANDPVSNYKKGKK
jgi:hypothetical protein